MMRRMHYYCSKHDRYFGVWCSSIVQQHVVFMRKKSNLSHHSKLVGVFRLNCRSDHPLTQCLHTCIQHCSRCIHASRTKKELFSADKKTTTTNTC